MNQFIKLFTVTLGTDNSMSRNVPVVYEHEFPLAIRPHLVESICHIRYGNLILTEVLLAGRNSPIHCKNDADNVLDQIAAIEQPRAVCEHPGLLTNAEGKSYCPDCRTEWNDANT